MMLETSARTSGSIRKSMLSLCAHSASHVLVKCSMCRRAPLRLRLQTWAGWTAGHASADPEQAGIGTGIGIVCAEPGGAMFALDIHSQGNTSERSMK